MAIRHFSKILDASWVFIYRSKRCQQNWDYQVIALTRYAFEEKENLWLWLKLATKRWWKCFYLSIPS